MRGRLTILLAASLCSTNVIAQTRAETWSCRSGGGGEVLVVATHQGRDTGTISVAGAEHSTRYAVEGFDRRWSFGPTIRGTSVRFLFVIQPDGGASYFDFAQGPSVQQRYRCEQGEVTERRAREQAEQRRREQADSEFLQQQLALEAERSAAPEVGLLDQYIRMIENKVKQNWQRPLSARPGLDCIVHVVQLPNGDVVSATVATCNGDEAVRRSIERAVMDASPLPRPPTPAVFDRNLSISFRPEE
jgi:hypothetical protein